MHVVRKVLLTVLMVGLIAAAPGHDPILFASGVISTGFDDSHPSFSPDGRTLYFLRNTPDFAHWTIMQSQLSGGTWLTPHVAPFSGEWDDADVFTTKDGSHLFFVSNRPGPGRAPERVDTDLWVMARNGHLWGEARRIAELSSEGYEWFPTMTDDGTIYFGSERPGGRGASDIWKSKWDGRSFSTPENLGAPINTSEQEIEPLVADDGSYLVVAARRDGRSKGAYDLFISYQCASGWTEPVPLPGKVNSEGWDFAPRLSPDRRTFFFTSNRSSFVKARTNRLNSAKLNSLLATPGNGLRDIYSLDARTLPLRRKC